ncbi:MAG: PilZ domain-containing protein [Arenimonas sp.]
MSEFRRAKRRKVHHTIEVVDTMTERMIGHLVDLSESGMLLVLSKPLVSDALYQLLFKLPDSHGIDRAIEIGAHELWSDPAAAPGQVWTGFRFIDIAGPDLAILRAWVSAPGSEHV